jgi:hypothetical protein
MFRPVLSALVLTLLPAISSAAIVFEPVQYQYRDAHCDRPAFYYGGSNPAVFMAGVMAQQRYHLGANPIHETALSSPLVGPLTDNLLHHGDMGAAPITYSDSLPPGSNAYPYGLTPDDARNDAYSNVPRYFRKRDLMNSAILLPTREVAIPAQAPLPGTLQMLPVHGWPTTQPATQSSQPTPILIIPKGLLDKKLNPKPTQQASAN